MFNIDKLSKRIGIKFDDEKIIHNAFIHRSYLNESKVFEYSNERLEFLGDSILSLLVSEYLYIKYENFSEGELTNLRSSVVKTSTLASISKNLDLGSFLYLSRGEEDGGGRNNPSILADTFEALLGAIYIDQGLKSCKKLLQNCLFPLLPQILIDKTYRDAKSEFQELIQDKERISPVYKVLSEIGPDHAKEFTVGVFVNNNLYGRGSGKSKQIAEMKAAKAALEKSTGI